ncbi:MAG TPA: GntG family PLP-dependent aldolase [Mycobacteriales bacterium]|nr:GntG family PLP-dependent aldolase [Mycobacteriales bacterium]
MIDLRSDTLTRPTEGMRAAMAAAEVGDDVYDEDPTVRALQERVAELFGHEAALFVPSGTMGNQLGVRLLVPPGAELLCDSEAHVITYEYGAAAVHGGVTTRTLPGAPLDASAYVAAIRPEGWGTVATAAIAVENTHNRGGGLVQPLPELRSLRARAGVPLHCDGARIWNAHIATGVPLSAYGGCFDTLSVCLSKGLGAPVGSLLVANADRIAAAREMRKRLGGGMRQVGILAAAGLYALEHQLERLAEDHVHAARLADLLDLPPVPTNIVPVEIADARATAAAAKAAGVLVSVVGPRRIRLVTHLGIERADIEAAGKALRPLL